MGSVLVGARNEKQVIDNAGALDFTLSEEEIAQLRKLLYNQRARPAPEGGLL